MLTAKMSPFVHPFTLWITCGQLWISTVSLVPVNRKLVCDIYGFTTIIITNQHKTYRHPPNTSHTYTSYSPPANCLLTCQPATQAANQAANQDNQDSKPSQPTRVLSTAQQHASHSQPQQQHSIINRSRSNQLLINQILDNVIRPASQHISLNCSRY